MLRSNLSQLWLNMFTHMPTITTKRLVLRPASMRDADDMYSWCSDPQVARYVLWDAHTSIRTTKNYLRYLIHQYRQGAPSTFVMEHRENGHAIGTIGFIWMDEQCRSCEVGYSMSRDYWNRGLMTEALQALIEFCFLKLKLNRVEAQHDVRNIASGRVMEKAGMRYEGSLRQRVFNKGQFIDVALYAILRSDYDTQHPRSKESGT